MPRMYLSPPDVGEAEREALLRAFDSNWIAPLGPDVDAFELEFASFVGAPAAAALSSGTAALHLGLLDAGVGRGDVVIVPTLTFAATANAVVYCGAEPWFVDSEADTLSIDPALVDRAITDARGAGRSVGAVVAVDLYGQCCPMDELLLVCRSHDVPLVEDAAESLGSTWRGRPAGSWGTRAAFSFNGNKIITTSGGGMFTGTEEQVARARYLASQARQPVLHYEHIEVGFNYRMSNLLAALGRAQLAGLPAKMARRGEIHRLYGKLIAEVEGIELVEWDSRGEPNGWLNVALLDPARLDPAQLDPAQLDPAQLEPGRDHVSAAIPTRICTALDAKDIEARPLWKPMHLQPVFAGAPVTRNGVADDAFARGICLPSGSAMTDDDVVRVVDELSAALRTL